MNYWLNIHDPDPIGERNDYRVYLKDIHEHTARYSINPGENIGVVYEIGWREGNTVTGSHGEPIALKQGRMGIVAVIEIGRFHEHRYVYNDDNYIGWFDIDRMIIHSDTDPLVGLHDLDTLWRHHLRKHFSPRINGGLRRLNLREWNVLSAHLGI